MTTAAQAATRLAARLAGSAGLARAGDSRPGLLASRDEPHLLQVERQLFVVRSLAVISTALAVPFAGLAPPDLKATYGVVLVGALYVLVLHGVIIKRAPRLLAGGYLTSTAEAAITSMAVAASGGGSSPLFLVYFLGVVAAALRFGLRVSLVTVGVSFATYLLALAAHPEGFVPSLGEVLLRLVFLLLTGLVAGYLAQEAQESRLALGTELERTRELHRQAEALARENVGLSASLRERVRELEQTQHQLIQSAKLAAIGELAANVAHEINNPLAAILANAEIMDEDLGLRFSHEAELRVVRDEALRARGIVRQLLDFARQPTPAKEVVDPRTILATTLPLVSKRATLKGVRLVEAHTGQPLEVRVDASQMKQVFINLLTNAIDAANEGGEVTLMAERRGAEVCVSVRDTGHGILPEHRDRLFEPFFTTKLETSGTGLGLSVSYGIVQRHGGTLTVESTPGHGATFTVHLPAVEHSPGPDR